MKILQVITSLRIGGAEKLIVDMVPLYQEQGHQVDVLLFDGTETPFKKQLRDKGVTIYEFGIGGTVYNPLYIFKLIPFLRKYDIVHTHNTACQLFAALGCVLCSVALTTTEHNTSNRRRNWKWYKLLDKWMYSRYRAVVSISPATTEQLINHVSIKCPVYTIPNGINVKTYQSAPPLERHALKCSDISFLVVMVAGFRNQKDQDTVIRAMKNLPTCIQLCLVGDGVRRNMCEQLTKELGLTDRVLFAGIRSDVSEVLKTADVVVMSSHFEGFGLAAVEGMATGKPVVATNVPGLAEVVQGAGILFPHGDAEALADIILRLKEEPSYYRQIADQCMRRASEYDIRKTIDLYLQLYKSLI